MAQMIPLIRAASVAPVVGWMRVRGAPWSESLRAAGINPAAMIAPDTPVAARSVGRFLVGVSRREGSDFGWWVISDATLAHLSNLGRVALGARTPREAFVRLSRAISHHSSHEQLSLEPRKGGAVLRHLLLLRLDEETLHVTQVYVAAIVRAILADTDHAGSPFLTVALTPHPVDGLEAFASCVGAPVKRSRSLALEIGLSDAALDAPYRRIGGDPPPAVPTADWPVIRGDATLAGSLRAILPDLVAIGETRVETLAALAGTSSRTLQRRLTEEGRSVKDLVDAARREKALSRIAGSADPIGSIAGEVGYMAHSSLTRAVRRWTEAPPLSLRGADRNR